MCFIVVFVFVFIFAYLFMIELRDDSPVKILENNFEVVVKIEVFLFFLQSTF